MRPFSLLAILGTFSLIACNPDDTGGDLSEFVDRDNDGFPETQDCDDLDAQIHPDAVEICDLVDNNCDGDTDGADAFDAPAWFVDADGDTFGQDGKYIYSCEQQVGYTQDRTDCNDADITAYPGAAEVCDGVDNDCDDQTDEGTALDAETWYRDGDNDGYGAALTSTQACDQPEGYVEDDTDCNDGDGDVNPGATEICNEIDDDCDTLVDDGDPSVEAEDAYVVDLDSDQWGDEDAAQELYCVMPLGYVPAAQQGDCDDEFSTINPSQAEICGDDIDNDCDDVVDEPDAPNPLGWYTDNDEDGYGSSSGTPVYSCESVSGRVANNDDCYDFDEEINPGAEETWYDGVDQDCNDESDYDADADGFIAEDFGGDDCEDSERLANPSLAEVCGDGLDNDCNGEGDPCELSAALYGEAEGDKAGSSVAAGGDINGDGNDDVVIGAPYHNGTLVEGVVAVGAAYVAYGPVEGVYTLDATDGKIEGIQEQDQVGSSVAIVGDTNNDGYDDVLAGAYGSDLGGATSGAAFLFLGPVDGVNDVDGAAAWMVGEIPGDRAGSSVSSAGDVDGDGRADMLIGAFEGGASFSGKISASGMTYLVLGGARDEVDLSYARTRFIGELAGDWSATSISRAGDVNGDGNEDLIIGAPLAHSTGEYFGAAYVVLGPPDEGDVLLSDADRMYVGVNAGDGAGGAVSGAGDVNNDGRSDLLIGASNNDAGAEGSGAAYLVSGSASSGSLSSALATLVGENRDDEAGSSVGMAGDVDGDGRADVLVGAQRDDYTDSDAGGAYVIFGPLVGTVDLSTAQGKVIGEAAGDYMGQAVAGGGDVNSDNFDDFIVGAPSADGSGADAGAAYVIYGGGF